MAHIQPTRLLLDDFYQFRQVVECALSPDGTRVAYIQKTPLRNKNDYTQTLWIAATDGSTPAVPLSRGQHWDRMPRWSPDGLHLAILSKREPEEADGELPASGDQPDLATQIWLYDLRHGGEPHQLTRRAEGVQSFSWSPDSTRLVFAAREPSSKDSSYLKAIRDKKHPGPLVLSRVQHKTDEDGYLDTVPTHLFVLEISNDAITPLTNGPASEWDPVWSPDAAWILFLSNRTGDADNNRRTDLWLISPENHTVRRLTRGDVDARWPSFSPDGRTVGYISSQEPENNYALNRLWTVSVSSARPDPTFPDNLGSGWTTIGGIVPDHPAGDPVAAARVYPVPESVTASTLVAPNFTGMMEGPIYYLDSDQLMVLASDRGQAKIFRCRRADDAIEVMWPHQRIATVMHFDARANQVAAVVNAPDTGPECLVLTQGEPRRLSHASSEWLSQRSTVPFHWLTYRDHDGEEIEGLVLKPPHVLPDSGPLPLLVSIHGGPMSYEAPEFEFETQYWANRGYLVLLVNYRGSTSYGEAFCQTIRGRWGPMEHDDIMCGVDAVIARGWADPDRLFCTGFSMGGIMTNWAVGHTDRFRAAVTEHGVWDYTSAFGTDDCHLWWQDDLGVPWQNPRGYYASSPLSGLENIRTPLLITAGEHDWRCPLSQAEQLYLALKKRGVDTELVVYPKEHHESDTRPARAIDRLARIDAWFARYGGIPVQP